MDKNKYSSDMKKEIREICTELNDGKIAVTQATEKLFNLFSVSKCYTENDMDNAYDKGFADAMKKYRTDL